MTHTPLTEAETAAMLDMICALPVKERGQIFDAVERLTAELATLRQALADERAGADAMGEALKAAKANSRKAYNKTENFHDVLNAVADAVNPALAAHTARREARG